MSKYITLIILGLHLISIVRSGEIDNEGIYPEPVPTLENTCSLWDSMYEKHKECLMNLAVQKYRLEHEKTTIVNHNSRTVMDLKIEIEDLKNIKSTRSVEYEMKLSELKKQIGDLTTEVSSIEIKMKKVNGDIVTVQNNNSEFESYIRRIRSQNDDLEMFLDTVKRDYQDLQTSCDNKKPDIGQGISDTD